MIMPPLEGFVMNRVTGDYLETLLYKIFVSMDEQTTVSETATLLQIELGLVKDAVSLYCRFDKLFLLKYTLEGLSQESKMPKKVKVLPQR